MGTREFWFLPKLLIVVVLLGVANDTLALEHTVLFCDFEQEWDVNYDRLPDHWTRDHRYPRYVPAYTEPTEVSGEALAIRLNGGGAIFYSPPFPVHHQFEYEVRADVSTTGLSRNRAFLSLRFLKAAGQNPGEIPPEDVTESRRLNGEVDWIEVTVTPTSPREEMRFAVVGLHLEPEGRSDLEGVASFDNVRVDLRPRIELAVSAPWGIYEESDEISIHCQAFGLMQEDLPLKFKIVDFSRDTAQAHETPLITRTVGVAPEVLQQLVPASLATETAVRAVEPALNTKKVFQGSGSWNVGRLPPGFYRVVAEIELPDSDYSLRRETGLTVLQNAKASPRGGFTWSLPQGTDPVPLRELPSFLSRMGINAVKLPMWRARREAESEDELAWLVDRLLDQQINVIGVLDQPPDEVKALLPVPESPHMADLFAGPVSVWFPHVEPLMTRFGLRIRWWQLGGDEDFSFVRLPGLDAVIGRVARSMTQFGQQIHLGFAWTWPQQDALSENTSWSFNIWNAQPPLTVEELDSHLHRAVESAPEKWVMITPLASDEHSAESRVRDFIERIVVCKRRNVGHIVIPQPFDDRIGLFHSSGTPTELLPVWRTLALALAGAEHLGPLELASHSRNEAFRQNEGFCMVVWNEGSEEETLFLGEDLEVRDVWGRSLPGGSEEQSLRLPPHKWPWLINGKNLPLLQWQRALQFEKSHLPSVLGTPHENALLVENPFPVPAQATLKLSLPDSWDVNQTIFQLQLPPRGSHRQPFSIRLPRDAQVGRQRVRVDVTLHAGAPYHFQAFRDISVGSQDLVVEVEADLNERGELEVEQRLINHTDEFVDFNGELYAPGRRRLMVFVRGHGQGVDTRTYFVENGRELAGETLWLRIEEQNGSRVFNHRFQVPEFD